MVNNDLTIIYVPKFVKHFFRVLLIEMKVNEGKVVFNYLKSINKNERDAYIQYDQMDAQQRKFILKNIIISYLVDCYYLIHYYLMELIGHPIKEGIAS